MSESSRRARSAWGRGGTKARGAPTTLAARSRRASSAGRGPVRRTPDQGAPKSPEVFCCCFVANADRDRRAPLPRGPGGAGGGRGLAESENKRTAGYNLSCPPGRRGAGPTATETAARDALPPAARPPGDDWRREVNSARRGPSAPRPLPRAALVRAPALPPAPPVSPPQPPESPSAAAGANNTGAGRGRPGGGDTRDGRAGSPRPPSPSRSLARSRQPRPSPRSYLLSLHVAVSLALPFRATDRPSRRRRPPLAGRPAGSRRGPPRATARAAPHSRTRQNRAAPHRRHHRAHRPTDPPQPPRRRRRHNPARGSSGRPPPSAPASTPPPRPPAAATRTLESASPTRPLRALLPPRAPPGRRHRQSPQRLSNRAGYLYSPPPSGPPQPASCALESRPLLRAQLRPNPPAQVDTLATRPAPRPRGFSNTPTSRALRCRRGTGAWGRQGRACTCSRTGTTRAPLGSTLGSLLSHLIPPLPTRGSLSRSSRDRSALGLRFRKVRLWKIKLLSARVFRVPARLRARWMVEARAGGRAGSSARPAPPGH